MLTANIINRVLFISSKLKTGTAFTIEIDNRQYLITARHLFFPQNDQSFLTQALPHIDQVEFLQNGQWVKYNATAINPQPDQTDIVAFALDQVITATLPTPVQSNGLIYSQDVYFLGFPYNIASQVKMHHSGPLPIVKKGIASTIPSLADGSQFFIDAINNIGFSGSPVVFLNHNNPEHLHIAGMISGYRPEAIHVLERGQKTSLYVQANSGLTICYAIDKCIEAIRGNPRGPLI